MTSRKSFLKLEDYRGSLELVIFPKILRQESKYLNSDAIMGFSGKIDTSREEPKFFVDEVILPEKIQKFDNSMVHIRMNRNSSTQT